MPRISDIRSFYNTSSGDRPDQVKEPLVSALVEEWLFQISLKSWPKDNKYDGDVKFLAYANIIHANKTAVGCYEAKCGDAGAAACVFNLSDLAKDELIYKTGNPCTSDSDCTTYKPSKCETSTRLCIVGSRPTTTTSTTKSTTTTTTTTSSTKTNTTPTTTSTTTPSTTTSSTTTTTTPTTPSTSTKTTTVSTAPTTPSTSTTPTTTTTTRTTPSRITKTSRTKTTRKATTTQKPG
ncbi:hypothetical protein Y032_0053g2331 [Ancylostoma ceylanicum]|uniref:SCP domain-containing protein n=1 Tax=Ancylostoma ceylanicum TaxID=53326 RepID=A0A016U7E0_9BILA|nr:hypothetical protein Y032_0053g2331 [Ancylostoma ceylanicum]